MRVIFTPLAERRIDRLHSYITAHASEKRADGYIGRIIAFCCGFTMFPELGTRRDDLLPRLRVIGFERRVTIAFVVTANAVLIEGVDYGGQNFETAVPGGLPNGVLAIKTMDARAFCGAEERVSCCVPRHGEEREARSSRKRGKQSRSRGRVSRFHHSGYLASCP